MNKNKFWDTTPNGWKYCKCCKQNKPFSEFYGPYGKTNPSKKGAYKARCKKCDIIKSLKYYTDDKNRRKKYKKDNYEKISKRNSEYHFENREEKLKGQKEWYYNGGGKEISVEYQKEYHKIPKVSAARSYRQSFRSCINRIGTKKEKHTIEYIGYTPEEFKLYIESLWEDGMTWKNHGQGKGTWQVDHIKEIMQFIDEGITDTKVIHALGNLQPLWNEEHSIKSGKFISQRHLKDKEK